MVHTMHFLESLSNTQGTRLDCSALPWGVPSAAEGVVAAGAEQGRWAAHPNACLTPPSGVLVTSYSMVLNNEELLGEGEWDWVVADEGHKLKNHAIKVRIHRCIFPYLNAHRRTRALSELVLSTGSF